MIVAHACTDSSKAGASPKEVPDRGTSLLSCGRRSGVVTFVDDINPA